MRFLQSPGPVDAGPTATPRPIFSGRLVAIRRAWWRRPRTKPVGLGDQQVPAPQPPSPSDPLGWHLRTSHVEHEDETGTMLTRSPALATPTNASPRSAFHPFHYAAAPSPRNSPSRVSAAAPSCRPSAATSPSLPITPSPPVPRPSRYVGVDASTQYSPMEHVDYATGAAALHPDPAAPPNGADGGAAGSSAPGGKPSAASSEGVAGSAVASSASAAGGSSQGSQKHGGAARASLSPGTKRRISQGPGNGIAPEPAEGAGRGPSALAKRPKPEEPPPKCLPQAYEFCAIEDVVVLIANMLGELIETNDPLAMKTGHLTRFHSRYVCRARSVIVCAAPSTDTPPKNSSGHLGSGLSPQAGETRHLESTAAPIHGLLH